MDWIHHYHLFLFDFDGLLVNTEEIHFLAYKNMCAHYEVDLNWDFNRYCQSAHYNSEKLRHDLYEEFPELFSIEPDWNVLYARKKQNVINLFREGAVHLMPGVEKLLNALKSAQIPCCVVTHSAQELIDVIRSKNPILNSISHWITREHYHHPKPNPECYQKAIDLFEKSNDLVIGFEDTPRGLEALLQTRAKPVLVCEAKYPEIANYLKKGVIHFTNFNEIPLTGLKLIGVNDLH